MVSKNPSDVRSSIESQRAGYAKRNELPLFIDDLITNHDLSRPYASAEAFPLKNNPALSKYVDSQPKSRFEGDIGRVMGLRKDSSKSNAVKFASDLPKYLGKNDSIGSILSNIFLIKK